MADPFLSLDPLDVEPASRSASFITEPVARRRPYSMDHQNLWPVRAYVQTFGLWRPFNRKRWLPWQLLNLLVVASFLALFTAVFLNPDLGRDDGPINTFFQEYTGLPTRFSAAWDIFTPSIALNALPVVCFLFAFSYHNWHFTWALDFRSGHEGLYVDGVDTEVHFNRIIASIPQLQHGVFEERVRARAQMLAVLHLLFAFLCTVFEMSKLERMRWHAAWSLLYFVWLLFWSAPVTASSLILSVVCEAHLLEYHMVVAYISSLSASSADLGTVWAICHDADLRLHETSRKFRVYFVLPFMLLIASAAYICVEAFGGQRARQNILETNQLWVFFYIGFFATVFLYGIFAVVAVTEEASTGVIEGVNDFGLPAAHLRRRHRSASSSDLAARSGCFAAGGAGVYSAERRQAVEHLKAYLVTLSSGFYLYGIRIDNSLISRSVAVCITVVTAVVQRMIRH